MQEQAVIPGVQTIMLERLTRDSRLQFRGSLDMARIADFAAAMQEGEQFPPIVAFWDDATLWLSDGYHRDAAAQANEWRTIDVDVRRGTFLDALFYAYRANAAPGHKQLSAHERRDGLRRLIELAPNESTYTIAERAGVAQSTVSRTKAAMATNANAVVDIPRLVTGKDGRTRNVASIGRSRPTPDESSNATDLCTGSDDSSDVASDQFDWPEEETESPEEKAFYTLGRMILLSRHDASAVAAACPHPDADLAGFAEFGRWYERFLAALGSRAARPIQAVQ